MLDWLFGKKSDNDKAEKKKQLEADFQEAAAFVTQMTEAKENNPLKYQDLEKGLESTSKNVKQLHKRIVAAKDDPRVVSQARKINPRLLNQSFDGDSDILTHMMILNFLANDKSTSNPDKQNDFDGFGGRRMGGGGAGGSWRDTNKEITKKSWFDSFDDPNYGSSNDNDFGSHDSGSSSSFDCD